MIWAPICGRGDIRLLIFPSLCSWMDIWMHTHNNAHHLSRGWQFSSFTHKVSFEFNIWLHSVPPSGLFRNQRRFSSVRGLAAERLYRLINEDREALCCVSFLLLAWGCKWGSYRCPVSSYARAERKDFFLFFQKIWSCVDGIFSSLKCGDVGQAHLTVRVGVLICIFTEMIPLQSRSRDLIIRN